MECSKKAILRQKIPQGSSHGEKAVNTPETYEAPKAERQNHRINQQRRKVHGAL